MDTAVLCFLCMFFKMFFIKAKKTCFYVFFKFANYDVFNIYDHSLVNGHISPAEFSRFQFLLITSLASAQRGWYCFQLCLCVCVCLSVCLSVNTITPGQLEISSLNLQGIILRSKSSAKARLQTEYHQLLLSP